MRAIVTLTGGLIVLVAAGMAGTTTACGDDDGTEPGEEICDEFSANTSGDLFFAPCGRVISTGVKSATTQCSSSSGEEWDVSVSVTRNALGQVVSYEATVTGTRCDGCTRFTNEKCVGTFNP